MFWSASVVDITSGEHVISIGELLKIYPAMDHSGLQRMLPSASPKKSILPTHLMKTRWSKSIWPSSASTKFEEDLTLRLNYRKISVLF